MAAFTITVEDKDVRSTLAELQQRASNLRPIMQTIGEDILERTKQRFSTSTGPDGRRWAPNSRVTIERYIASKGGFGKKGVTKKGAGIAMSKKPLIGHSGDLSRQFFVRSDNRSVTIGNSMIYAAIQQFGGQAGRGRKVTIPARPFLPITESGLLFPAEKAKVLEALNDWLVSR